MFVTLLRRASLLVLWGLAGTGCGPSLSSNHFLGEKGKLVFSLADCLHCAPVAIRIGSQKALLSVTLVEPGFPIGRRTFLRGTFGVSSSDPAVMGAAVNAANDPPTFELAALAEGTTRIAVLNELGVELDATKVTAARATALTLFSDTVTRAAIETIEVGAGAELNVFVRADGAEGPLVTGSHWTWWTDDASVATLWDPPAALLVPGATNVRVEDTMQFIYLSGRKSGQTRLHVRDANAEASIAVVVP